MWRSRSTDSAGGSGWRAVMRARAARVGNPYIGNRVCGAVRDVLNLTSVPKRHFLRM